MQFSAYQIAGMIQGIIEGDEAVTISSLAKIEEAGAGELSCLANPKYYHHIYTTRASIVIVDEKLNLERPVSSTLIRVKDAYSAFSTLLELYNGMRLDKNGIEEPCFIHEEASVGQDVYIGAFAYIGKGAQIGDRCKIYPNVYIGDRKSTRLNSS